MATVRLRHASQRADWKAEATLGAEEEARRLRYVLQGKGFTFQSTIRVKSQESSPVKVAREGQDPNLVKPNVVKPTLVKLCMPMTGKSPLQPRIRNLREAAD